MPFVWCGWLCKRFSIQEEWMPKISTNPHSHHTTPWYFVAVMDVTVLSAIAHALYKLLLGHILIQWIAWCFSLYSVADLRQKVSQEHEVVKKKELEQGPKASYGYGGKFGVEKDRMDKVRFPALCCKRCICLCKSDYLVHLSFLKTFRVVCQELFQWIGHWVPAPFMHKTDRQTDRHKLTAIFYTQ